MEHNLKIKSKYFTDILFNNKRFEFRKNDRSYKVGDILVLKELTPDGKYTGNEIHTEITYILSSAEFKPLGEYVVLGFREFLYYPRRSFDEMCYDVYLFD